MEKWAVFMSIMDGPINAKIIATFPTPEEAYTCLNGIEGPDDMRTKDYLITKYKMYTMRALLIKCARCGLEAVSYHAAGDRYVPDAVLCDACLLWTTEYPDECDACGMSGYPLLKAVWEVDEFTDKTIVAYSQNIDVNVCPVCWDEFKARTYQTWMNSGDDILCEGYTSLEAAYNSVRELAKDEDNWKYFPIVVVASNQDWNINEYVTTFER